jgi:hypothetical protein
MTVIEQQKKESGATILEFAIVSVFVFMLIGGVFDIGFGLYEYTYLHYTTTRAAREIAAKLATGGTCNDIRTHLSSVAHREMSEAFTAGAEASWGYCEAQIGHSECLSPGGPNPQLKSFRLIGQLPIHCYFLCRFLPAGLTVSTTISATIDGPTPAICPAVAVPAPH